ncbi:MAG: succinate dehydrogenase, cytochrome b556 subunit, partial [Hyphomicrobium sp.]
GCTWALIHHMIGGIRHFVWDSGSGLDIPTVDFLSWGTIVLSVILTAGLWLYVAFERGWFSL